jgi:hypothetical protein
VHFIPVNSILLLCLLDCRQPATSLPFRHPHRPPPGLNPKNNRTPTLGTLIAVYGNATEEEVRSLGHVVYRL